MKILVTGGNGFIGRNIVNKLAEKGHYVVVPTARLNDKKVVDDIFHEHKPDVVFHLAANAAEGKSQFSPIEITQNNIGIFMNTIVPFIKYGGKKFIFTSSVAVYGDMMTPFKESDPPTPQDIYGINKLAIERSLRVLAKVHNFNFGIVRPHNVYGPGQNMTDPYRNVVTLFMNAILKNEPYYIYGDGSMQRCFSYIDDVVDVIYQMLDDSANGMTVNVGSDKSYTINELSNIIREVSKTDVRMKYVADRPQEVHIAEADHTLCKRVFGYKDTPLGYGIKKTWEWVKKQGPQEQIFTELEINDYRQVPKQWII